MTTFSYYRNNRCEITSLSSFSSLRSITSFVISATFALGIFEMTLLPDAHAAFISSHPKHKSMPGLTTQTHQSIFTSSAAHHLPPNLQHNLLRDQQRFMPCLMASVACNDGRVQVPRDIKTSDEADGKTQTHNFTLFHRTFRPMSLASRQAAPILVLHGGPGIPSDYLFPLVDVVPYRSMVFYDQLGCGRSDAPSDPSL